MLVTSFSQISLHSLFAGAGKDRSDLQRGNGRHSYRGECCHGERRQISCGAVHTQWRQRHITGGQPACHRTFPLR